MLTIAAGETFGSMDRHSHYLNPNNVLTEYMFNRLVRFDANFHPEPDPATSWKPVDPITWEFRPRDAVTFREGSPFTADDVMFTFGRIPTVLHSPSCFNFAAKLITGIEVVERFRQRPPIALVRCAERLVRSGLLMPPSPADARDSLPALSSPPH